MAAPTDVTSMALFCDFENVALGVRDANYEKFDIKKVLERLLLKGSIVVKKAYCDWDRYKAFKGQMHEANFELIEIPHVRQSGKNSADIRMVVDALDLCYTKEHVDTFVIISGDSDFSPLVSKLRENAKTVIGVGVKNSTSDLLIANCDEFIYYDDLVREQRKGRRTTVVKEPGKTATKAAAKTAAPDVAAEEPVVVAKTSGRRSAKTAAAPAAEAPRATSRRRGRTSTASVDAPPVEAVDDTPRDALPDADRGPAGSAEAQGDPDGRHQAGIAIVVDTLEALSSERGSDRIFGSMIKQAIKRVRPQFSEGFHGFRSFNAMLEAAQAAGALDLERDEKSGGYVVRLRGTLA